MKKMYNSRILQALLVVFIFSISLLAFRGEAKAQIYEPEGLNMPGAWNGWTNPPTNNLALASYTQVTGGRVTKITNGTTRWQTVFSAAASGGDVVGGTHQWLFTSGSTGSPWGNKWGNVTVVMNTLQTYTYSTGAANNSITLINGKWYTMNWQDNGYTGTQAIYMETSAQPIDIQSVTVPAIVPAGTPVTVNATLSGTPSAEEIIYLRYTTNNWTSSSLLTMTVAGAAASAVIPAQLSGITVACYVFSSTATGITSNYDMYSIRVNNNGGINYSYPVGAAPIGWANVQSPATATIDPGNYVDVYAQVYVAGATGNPTPAPDIQGWIGYNDANTDPSTWTNWVSATFVGPSGTNDEYKAPIGSTLAPGTYYYASRFQKGLDAYVYGGYNGGFWNGTSNVSGILTVAGAPPAISTGIVSNILYNSADISGTVIGDGGATVTEKGICWSTDPNPTLSDSFVVSGSGIGSFSATASPLEGGTTYHARAFATNIYGTSYGEDIEFTTSFMVVFNVDMSTAVGFVPETDLVYLAGGFPGAFWNEPGTNPAMLMSQVGTTLTYSLTLSLPAGSYEYKYFKNAGWGGGEWGGGSNRSVAFSGNTTFNDTWGGFINWANLQSPATGTILPSTSFDVYAQANIPNGITGVTGGAAGLQCWIGYSDTDTDPATWSNWIPASYFGPAGANDEFLAEIGTAISTAGTYYYASRFRFGSGNYSYGGFNSGFWDGVTNVSGVLSVVNGFVLSVTTGNVTAVTATTATVEGNVLADGGDPVTSRGICWSENPDPTVYDNVTLEGSGLGIFLGTLTSLTTGTSYFARAFAINSADTVYGDNVGFSTNYLVTFNVDMTTAEGFVPGVDTVYLAGAFPIAFWNEPGTNPAMIMNPSGGLTYTLQIPAPAGTYNFKHFLNAGWDGGEWGGGTDRSVTVSSNMEVNSIWGGELNWVNLQWPDSGTIDLGNAFDVYAQAYIPNGRTGNDTVAYGLNAWIGYSTSNTNPETWTNWVPAAYFGAAGGNDEFKADLGSVIGETGTYYYASRFQAGAGPFVYGGYNSGFWDGSTNVSGVLTINEPILTKTLNLKVYLEGLYAGGGLMNQAKDENGLPVFGGSIADSLTIELHNESDYSIIEYAAHGVLLGTDGNVQLTGIPAIHSGSYFVTIKHRNSIATTTASPQSFAGQTITYDFSLSASQAYGDNLQNISGVYAIFGGDENKDGLVDSSDMIDADNDAAAFAIGYIQTDVNGDGLVDASDMILIDNNAAAFVASILP